MILGFLFSILTATYTLSSTTTVEASGDVPEGSAYYYSRSASTGQKGQMTAGNSTTLRLSGWFGCTIDSVVLSMRSNKEQGAGSMEMRIGERVVWRITDSAFADKAWHGSYTTDWVDISKGMHEKVGAGEDVEICIEASKNSLYINSYTIYYSQPAPEAYEVCFVTGLSESPDCLMERTIGSGVVLPNGVDTLAWHFLGWSEKDVLEEVACPTIWKAGECYFPKTNCTLWAVYADSDGVVAVNDCQSGEYVIASSYFNVAMSDGVNGKEIATTSVVIDTTEIGDYCLASDVHNNMVYRIDFKEDSMAMIRHAASNTMVGYGGTYLQNNEAVWHYRILSDGSCCFYYQDDALSRMLYIGYNLAGEHKELVAYVIPVDLSKMQQGGLLLFPVTEVHFTSWPFGKFDGVDDVICTEKETGEYILRFGSYTLYIKSGKKYLHIGQ